jgi:hypothetical protein
VLLRWRPAMREQFANTTGGLQWQPFQDVFQIGVGIMAVEPGRVNQAHDGRGPLAGAQAAGKQPVVAADGNRADLVLDPVVVDRQMTIIEIARERSPAAKAVIDRPGSCAAFRYPFTLCQQPGVQDIGCRSALL